MISLKSLAASRLAHAAAFLALLVPWSRAELPATGLFARTNLVAWCIVPFDAKKRGPEERAAMLERLGLRHLAYDWRAEHIPTFDAEVEALARHGIGLTAWWFSTTLDADARTILGVLERHKLRTQLWVMGAGGPVKDEAEQRARVRAEADRIRPIAEAAARIGCTVELYNHGGWFGEPENQLAIIEELKLSNVGIVYNLHHGHEHLDRFPQLLKKMLPHLHALNLNGMTRGAEKILPLGQGQMDLQLLRIIRDSGYRGPIGILNHTDEDAEARLKDNLDGLEWLVGQLDGQPAGPGPKPRSWRAPTQAQREPIGHGAQFVKRPACSCDGVQKKGIFAHPPYQGAKGRVVGQFDIHLNDARDPILTFFMGIQDRHGSDQGLVYRVMAGDRELWSEFWKEAKWQPVRVSLKEFAGKAVTLELAVDSLGEHYANWGEPKVVDGDKVLFDLADLADQAKRFVDLMDALPETDLPASLKQQRARLAQESRDVVPTPGQLAWQEMEFIAFAHFGMNTFTDREWGEGKEEPGPVQPHGVRRPAMGVGAQGGRHPHAHPDRQAPRRLLPLAEPVHRALREEQPLARRQGRRGPRGGRRLREAGLKFGVYLSPWDRHEPTYGDSPKYNEHFKNQLRELLTNYGEITEVWFDGACGEGPNGKRQVYDWPGYYALDPRAPAQGPDRHLRARHPLGGQRERRGPGKRVERAAGRSRPAPGPAGAWSGSPPSAMSRFALAGSTTPKKTTRSNRSATFSTSTINPWAATRSSCSTSRPTAAA